MTGSTELRYTELLELFQLDYGITETQVLRALNTSKKEVTKEHLITLAGYKQCLDGKHATPKDIFHESVESKIASDVISRL